MLHAGGGIFQGATIPEQPWGRSEDVCTHGGIMRRRVPSMNGVVHGSCGSSLGIRWKLPAAAKGHAKTAALRAHACGSHRNAWKSSVWLCVSRHCIMRITSLGTKDGLSGTPAVMPTLSESNCHIRLSGRTQ